MSEIVAKWRGLQKGPLVPRANQPSVPKPEGRAPPNQAEIASRYAPRMPQRRELTQQEAGSLYPQYVSKRPELLNRLARRGLFDFGEKYVSRMVGFNALPQIIASLTNKPLQALINYGPPALQKAILHAVGVKPGMGAARLVDTMIQGGAGKIPGLNWGSDLLFLPAPRSSLNIPENRLQYFRSKQTRR